MAETAKTARELYRPVPPHQCELGGGARDAPRGTVWQCACGRVWRAWRNTTGACDGRGWEPCGPLARWRLRRKGVLRG